MLGLIVLWSLFIFLISAQVIVPTTTSSSIQTSIQTSSSSTTSSVPSSFSLGFSSTSTSISTLISSTSTTPTTTTPTTVGQGPVGRPAPTTGTPGGPTPYTYTTIANGVTQVVTALFNPTNPTTSLVTPTLTGTVLDYSSWLAIYGPTQTSSAGAGYQLPPIPFTLILIILLGMLGGGGMLYV